MKKIMVVIVGAIFLLGACSNDNAQPKPVTNTVSSTNVDGPFDAQKAENDYKVCAACHGADLQGSKGGAGFDAPISGLSKEAVLLSIQEGPGVMPKNMVTGEAAENLSAWIAAQK